MFDSHLAKYRVTSHAVLLGGTWFVVDLCQCGSVHAYCMDLEARHASMPRIEAEQLSNEIREHILTRSGLKNQKQLKSA